MMTVRLQALLLIGAGLVLLLAAWLVSRRPKAVEGPVIVTVGDVRAMHAEVWAGQREVKGSARLADGDAVKTGPDGRAKVKLDDGTLVVVDRSTELDLHGGRLTLARGRLFVRAGSASRTEVKVDGVSTTMSSTAAAFEKDAGDAKVYCAQGELVVSAGGKQDHVASGETATVDAAGVKVRPETAFDDWTGGLAVPWSGEGGPSSAIAEVWGGSGGEDPGSPLVVRSEAVDVEIDGEVAVTRARTSYFNGSDRSVVAGVRMALPPGAILSRVAKASEASESEATLAIGDMGADHPSSARLEWAGGGAMRGSLPNVNPGSTVDLLVEYVEWLPIRGGRATYRFPMSTEGEPPLVGDLHAAVTLVGVRSPWASASTGLAVSDGRAEIHRADVRPTGDLVVETVPSVVRKGLARAYVAPGGKGEDAYVLFRTEVPEVTGSGTVLALVVDTSMSAGVSSLETERAVVDAVLEGLGAHDSLVVLAADQTVRALGPGHPASVTPELRTQLRADLAAVHAGGASNVAAALEQAADLLDTASLGAQGAGMVVYVGDGRPTVGEATAQEIRKRLRRRAGGVPRLGAVSVGEGADRWMLAQLVAGAGPVYEVIDRPDAARAGAALVSEALEPTLRDVDLDLGPTIDRIYPREARAALAGTTVMVTGRLRGKLPATIGFRYRRGTELVEESRLVDVVPVPKGGDVMKRWAAARIEEMAARGDGVEASVALAAQAKLVTPWTGWYFYPDHYSAPFPQRVLQLSPVLDAPFAPRVEPEPTPPSLLFEPPKTFDASVSLEEAASIAAERAIDQARRLVATCRDARAAVRPDVTGSLHVELVVGLDGHASTVQVRASSPIEDDPVLDRCVRGVIAAIPFFPAGSPVKVTHTINFPQSRGSRRTQCSTASALPLPVRRGIWRARQKSGHLDYVAASRWCELPSWSHRRELLELLLEPMSAGNFAGQAISLAENLEAAGEADAAAFVRQEILRRANVSATSQEELRAMLIGHEPGIDKELEKAFAKTKTDDERLAVLRRFLQLAPHSPLAQRRLLAVLEAMGQKDTLVEEIQRIRQDPFADGGLLAAGASALRRVGLDAEGRRAFGELIERAPNDPWTLAYVGDRLRAERLFDEAVEAYERLDRAMPDDPAVALRLALAHAGAGRLDAATRLLERVAQTGGRGDDGRLGELASITAAGLLEAARQGTPGPETEALLVRSLVQTPLPDVASLVIVRSSPADDPVLLRIARSDKDRDEEPADLDAASMGLSAVRIERGSGVARIHLKRSGAAGLDRPVHATVMALVLADDRASTHLVSREVDVAAGDAGVVLRWNGESLL
jgi:tetratricopeptide (TPR) repeat protein